MRDYSKYFEKVRRDSLNKRINSKGKYEKELETVPGLNDRIHKSEGDLNYINGIVRGPYRLFEVRDGSGAYPNYSYEVHRDSMGYPRWYTGRQNALAAARRYIKNGLDRDVSKIYIQAEDDDGIPKKDSYNVVWQRNN